MKKLITMLILVVAIRSESQVFSIGFTQFQSYDKKEQKYNPEVPVRVTVRIDIEYKTLAITSGTTTLLTTDILEVKDETEAGVTYKCQESKSKKLWTLCIINEEKYQLFTGKSNKENWIYKIPFN